MKKCMFLALVAMAFIACEKSPDTPSKIYSGHIFGTLGCTDEQHENFYKGYFIVTNESDTVLSFNLDVKDSITVPYGTYSIRNIEIPYLFTISVLKLTDSGYIHFAPPVEDAMHYRPITKPLDEIPQAIITPCK